MKLVLALTSPVLKGIQNPKTGIKGKVKNGKWTQPETGDVSAKSR
jgi:hypothetical protein